METQPSIGTPPRVATLEIVEARCGPGDGPPSKASSDTQAASGAAALSCWLRIKCKSGEELCLEGQGTTEELAIEQALAPLCMRPFQVESARVIEQTDGQLQALVAVSAAPTGSGQSERAGVGRNIAGQRDMALIVATLRAVSHAGLLRAAYRANNQKVFRGWSRELIEELSEVFRLPTLDRWQQLEAEGLALETINRVASAAVLTAVNHPRPDSILSLFDTSAWLFDSRGQRRAAYTDTDLWLAWYPGIDNDDLTVDEVISSMPAAPESKIPWIVKLFENPDSWIRFRGAVDLEDHDVMHVLLGRGLQDQDEAFVLGFAMGTAKRVSRWQYWVFKFVLARLYPEPYRIPKFLQPAFDLGVKCGQATGSKNLYRQPLKQLRSLTLREARQQAGIDLQVVRQFYEREQQQIPFTIASLRLP